jgi:hypothetical protein
VHEGRTTIVRLHVRNSHVLQNTSTVKKKSELVLRTPTTYRFYW